MIKICIAVLTLVFPIILSESVAQPVRGGALDQWVTVGSDATHPVAIAQKFDLTFGADQLPVLVYVDPVNSMLNLTKWDGHVWTNQLSLNSFGTVPLQVRAARSWSGDVIVGLLSSDGGGTMIGVYQLRGPQLNRWVKAFPGRAQSFSP